MKKHNSGVFCSVAAFTLWGFFPVFFRQAEHIPALEIVAHRIVWSCVFCSLLVFVRREAHALIICLTDKRQFLLLATAAVLIFANWMIFVWAVNQGFIVEAGLGYYINPLMSIFLGMAFFGERPVILQKVAIVIATIAVTCLVAMVGYLPWIALSLGFTFGLYGLVKKKVKITSIVGNTVETIILLPFSLIYLATPEFSRDNSFIDRNFEDRSLLVSLGLVTALPLLLFATAAKKIPLSVIAITQFVTPTLHVLIGVLLYNENFSVDRQITFGLIFLALAIYIYDSLKRRK